MQLRPPRTLHRVGVEEGIAEAARLCFQLLQHRAGGLVELRREEIGFPVTVAGLVAMPLRRAAPDRRNADEHKLVRAEILITQGGNHGFDELLRRVLERVAGAGTHVVEDVVAADHHEEDGIGQGSGAARGKVDPGEEEGGGGVGG